MTEKPIDRFKEEVYKVIEYHLREYQITYAEMIGQLEFIQQGLVQSAMEADRPEPPNPKDEW